ncbi:MAG: S8 family serine peptidase [Polyangiales bacterium]
MNRIIGSRDGAGGRAGYTGRTLVLLAEGAGSAGHDELNKRAGIRVSSVDGARADDSGAAETARGSVCFDRLGVAVVESDPEQTSRIAEAVSDSASPILATEPERVVHALPARSARIQVPAAPSELIGTQDLLLPFPPENENRALDPRLTRDFLRGYREAIAHLEELFFAGELPAEAWVSELLVQPAAAAATWGLTLTKVTASQRTGKGIRIAVLDTGLDLRHPDFVERSVVSQSFVTGETAQDTLGHGTHCIGTAAGPLRPSSGGPRYGVAHGAQIYAGKVLDRTGTGGDAGILAGIDWAVGNGCQIVSMSLGAEVAPGESFSQVFEAAARRAAQQGTLLIAAAGNESERPGRIAPVGHPANCPSVVAVGALDQQLRVAEFSNGGLTSGGGEVNIAGPGVGILSAWPMPTRTRTISGTSMATPHVAGIAALFAEASGDRGFALANAMLRATRRLTPARDFGWGLVQSV